MKDSVIDRALDCNHLPDACTNDIREERLMSRQQKVENKSTLERIISRDRNLLIACVILVICMNTTEGRYLLYPFRIFSTWIHEMCHGIAALIMGGRIDKLEIFADGSGLAYTAVKEGWRQGFVSAGGYPGTAVTGCVLLLYRRTTLGPTIGMIFLGVSLLLSVALWVRNEFGVTMLLIEGVVILACAWKLPAHFLDNLYNFLAATCCLNAVEAIRDLFGDQEYYAGGQVITNTDAHTVADVWGGDYRMWATIWLSWSLGLTLIGIYFARDAKGWTGNKTPKAKVAKTVQPDGNLPTYYTAPTVTASPPAPSTPSAPTAEVIPVAVPVHQGAPTTLY